MALPGADKFHDATGGRFRRADDGGREVFVHSSVLLRSGIADLLPGRQVFVYAETVPRRLLQATQIVRIWANGAGRAPTVPDSLCRPATLVASVHAYTGYRHGDGVWSTARRVDGVL